MAAAYACLLILEEIEKQELELLRNKKAVVSEVVFRDDSDLLSVPDEELIRKYNLPRHVIVDLCSKLEPSLRSSSNSSVAQLLTALGFYASGSFKDAPAWVDDLSEIVRSVSWAISKIATEYVKFPVDEEGFRTLKHGFFSISEFPKVIGVVGNCHVQIETQKEDPTSFLNSWGKSSINCQLICDSQMRLLDLVAKFKGGVPHYVIWHNSGVKHRCDSGKLPYGWLLGGHSHPPHVQLLTPLLSPTQKSEKKYNASHAETREVTKRCVSLLKGRFQCLDSGKCVLEYDAVTSASIIVATAVLHNICLDISLPLDSQRHCRYKEPTSTSRNEIVDFAALETRKQLIALMFS